MEEVFSSVVGEWDRWDADGNGCVDFNEFVIAVTNLLTNCQDEEVVKRAVKMFDTVILFRTSTA